MNPEWIFGLIIGGGLIVSIAMSLAEKKLSLKRGKRRKSTTRRNTKKVGMSKPINRAELRSDKVILTTPINDLSAKEFERLCALYFREYKGYKVEEPGQKGNDGGVDIIYTDRKGVRTAVQCKHWPNRTVGPDVMRDLNTAKSKVHPSCLYGLLVTSGEVSKGVIDIANTTAGLDYWHGSKLESRLSKWEKWKGRRAPS